MWDGKVCLFICILFPVCVYVKGLKRGLGVEVCIIWKLVGMRLGWYGRCVWYAVLAWIMG